MSDNTLCCPKCGASGKHLMLTMFTQIDFYLKDDGSIDEMYYIDKDELLDKVQQMNEYDIQCYKCGYLGKAVLDDPFCPNKVLEMKERL